MTKPKVSVCVPVYNTEKYLKECLDSLVNQSLHDIEIVCVDDGSTDSSPKILDDYAKKYRNIKVIHQKNTGLGGARDTGVRESTGDFIGFLDSDDTVDVEMYEKLYNLATTHSAEIAFCNLNLFPKDIKTNKKIWYNPYKGVIDGDFMYRNTQPTNKIFSRKLFTRLNATFEKNDSVCILLMLEAKGLCSTDEAMYHYRVGHASMSNSFKIHEFIGTVEQIGKIREHVRNKKGVSNDLLEYFDFMMIDAIIKTLAVASAKGKKDVYIKFKKALRDYDPKCNKYCRKIFMKEQGRLKYLAIMNILPRSYLVSRLLIGAMLRGKLQ